MPNLIADFRYTLRMFLRRPGLPLLAILSLGLGIGANTTIFSFVNAILLRLPPVQDPAALTELYTFYPGPGEPLGG